MNIDDILLKYKKIIKNIDTIIGTKHILDILQNRNLKIYWGTTPSCLPNLNYIIPLLKIKNFIDNDCEITILLADIHAYLDSKKSNYEILSIRTDIHQKIIKMLLKYLDINTDNIKFVQGSSYQLSQEFTMDVYKFNSLCSVSKVKKAGEKAVIQSADPLMTSLLYPTLQALDIEYLECDVYFGDINQKDICLLANDIMEQLNYNKKGFFLNNIFDNLKNMNKINMLDSYDIIKNKIINIDINSIIDILEQIIIPICNIKNIFININNFELNDLDDIKNKYNNKNIDINDIKLSIIDFIDNIISIIRDEFSDDYSQKLLQDSKYNIT